MEVGYLVFSHPMTAGYFALVHPAPQQHSYVSIGMSYVSVGWPQGSSYRDLAVENLTGYSFLRLHHC